MQRVGVSVFLCVCELGEGGDERERARERDGMTEREDSVKCAV